MASEGNEGLQQQVAGQTERSTFLRGSSADLKSVSSRLAFWACVTELHLLATALEF
jgi:hypothetical protein